MAKTLAMILAGGAGTRLEPLTRERAKPAVPFGGRYRIIDFVLSNFANSGLYKVKVLTQYKSDSLNNHLSRTWRMTAFLGHYVEAVPAQMRTGLDWYKGSADAIYQNLNLISDEEPEQVFVFGADHVYRMDVRQMLDFHLEHRADCTVAAIPVPIEQGKDFGIIDVGPDGEMRGFVEKPKHPPPMPGNPAMCLASMGNYLFATETLVQEVVRDAARENSAHDFGKSILGELHQRARVFVYDFAKNEVPGMEPKERGYWRDVGDIDSYFEANMELVDVDPVFNLYNVRWPIFTQVQHYPPAKFVFADQATGRVGYATDSPGLRGLHHLRRPRAPLGALAQGAREFLLHRRAMHPLRERADWPPLQHQEGHHRQERGDPGGNHHRLRPGGGPPALPRHREGVVVIPKGMKVG